MGNERHLPFGDFRPNHSCCFKLQKNNENRVHLEGTEWHLLIDLTHSPVLKVSVAPFKEICPVHGPRDQVWAGGEISASSILPLPPPLRHGWNFSVRGHSTDISASTHGRVLKYDRIITVYAEESPITKGFYG